jgi:hypothetical protein
MFPSIFTWKPFSSRFLFRALLLFLTDGASGIGDLTPGITMPGSASPTVWDEQLPISTS